MMPNIKLIETGRVTVQENGCYKKVKVYYLGWVHGLSNSKFIISSITGEKETECVMDVITPTVTFEVRQRQPEQLPLWDTCNLWKIPKGYDT